MKRVQLLLKTEIDDKMAVHFFPPVETDDSRKQFFGTFLTLIVSAHLFFRFFIFYLKGFNNIFAIKSILFIEG